MYGALSPLISFLNDFCLPSNIYTNGFFLLTKWATSSIPSSLNWLSFLECSSSLIPVSLFSSVMCLLPDHLLRGHFGNASPLMLPIAKSLAIS